MEYPFPACAVGRAGGRRFGYSGAVMQSVFGNPLAGAGRDWCFLGAAVGAFVDCVEPAVLRYFHDPAFAFVGALAATALVYFCRVLRVVRRSCR